MFPKIMAPPNHPWINRLFHHKPSILGYPYVWKHPYVGLTQFSAPDRKPSTKESRRFDLGRQPKDLRRQGTSAVEGTGDWLLSLCKAEVLWNPQMTKRALKFR